MSNIFVYGCTGIGLGFSLCAVMFLGGCVYCVKSCAEAPSKTIETIRDANLEAKKEQESLVLSKWNYLISGGMAAKKNIALEKIKKVMPPNEINIDFLCTEDQLIDIFKNEFPNEPIYQSKLMSEYMLKEKQVVLISCLVSSLGTWGAEKYIRGTSDSGNIVELYVENLNGIESGNKVNAIGSLREVGNDVISFKFDKCQILSTVNPGSGVINSMINTELKPEDVENISKSSFVKKITHGDAIAGSASDIIHELCVIRNTYGNNMANGGFFNKYKQRWVCQRGYISEIEFKSESTCIYLNGDGENRIKALFRVPLDSRNVKKGDVIKFIGRFSEFNSGAFIPHVIEDCLTIP